MKPEFSSYQDNLGQSCVEVLRKAAPLIVTAGETPSTNNEVPPRTMTCLDGCSIVDLSSLSDLQTKTSHNVDVRPVPMFPLFQSFHI